MVSEGWRIDKTILFRVLSIDDWNAKKSANGFDVKPCKTNKAGLERTVEKTISAAPLPLKVSMFNKLILWSFDYIRVNRGHVIIKSQNNWDENVINEVSFKHNF